jgi:RimJ/RimL family protein N-acetyltransferase
MKIVLETERLTLREMVPEDLDFLALMLADPEVMRHYPKTLERTEADAWLNRQFERYAEFGHGLWLVQQRATGEPIGQVGLIMQPVEGGLQPEIGYLLHRPFWHQGFATEAAVGVRDHAFFVRDKPRVISLIRPTNTPSQAVARRIGMALEREVSFNDRPTLMFSVTRPVRGS